MFSLSPLTEMDRVAEFTVFVAILDKMTTAIDHFDSVCLSNRRRTSNCKLLVIALSIFFTVYVIAGFPWYYEDCAEKLASCGFDDSTKNGYTTPRQLLHTRVVGWQEKKPRKRNRKDCTLKLASYGFDDLTKNGYIRTSGGSSEDIYALGKITRYRGVTIVELDPTTCTTRNRQNFDTHASADDRKSLLEALEWATKGTIIVGVTADSVTDETFKYSDDSFYAKYNMDLTGLASREKFLFIVQKGYPTKTVFQKKSRYGESLEVAVSLLDSTATDVAFKIIV